MVKKIRRRVEITSETLMAFPMVLPLAVVAGEGRKAAPFGSVSPSWRLTDFFDEHFGLSILAGNRAMDVRDYAAWDLRNRPSEVVNTHGEARSIPIPEVNASPADFRVGIVPCVAVLTRDKKKEFARLAEEGFDEVSGTVLKRILEEGMGLVPGLDRVFFLPPIHARVMDKALAHLEAVVHDACRGAGRPVPGPFPSVPQAAMRDIPEGEVVRPSASKS